MRRHPSRVIVAALALCLLAACSTAKDSSGAKSANDSAGNDKSSSGTSGGGDSTNNGSGEIGIDQPDPSKVIFSKQFAVRGEPQHKVTVGILSLARQNQVLMLKVVVTPDFADKSGGETITFAQALGDGYWSPTLLDLKNLKKYSMLGLTYQKGYAVNAQPIYGWAAFAPPPEGVRSVDLSMTDWMPRITNVPIT
jgi:hypothetical protein